jgi:hypothetical protein
MSQIPLSGTASADRPEYDKLRDDKMRQIAPDLAYRQIAIVNVIFYGRAGAGDRNWTLIDTGRSRFRHSVSGSGAVWGRRPAECNRIDARAFRSRPSARNAGQGVGRTGLRPQAGASLFERSESYPPPDPTVGGGLCHCFLRLARKPVDVSERLRPLPDDGSVGNARMAVATHAGARPGPRFAVARKR